MQMIEQARMVCGLGTKIEVILSLRDPLHINI